MRTASELFWPKVNVGWTDECWEWTARVANNGYGHFGTGRNRGMSTLAHRVSYHLIRRASWQRQNDKRKKVG